jgi:hypothetical protein
MEVHGTLHINVVLPLPVSACRIDKRKVECQDIAPCSAARCAQAAQPVRVEPRRSVIWKVRGLPLRRNSGRSRSAIHSRGLWFARA